MAAESTDDADSIRVSCVFFPCASMASYSFVKDDIPKGGAVPSEVFFVDAVTLVGPATEGFDNVAHAVVVFKYP